MTTDLPRSAAAVIMDARNKCGQDNWMVLTKYLPAFFAGVRGCAPVGSGAAKGGGWAIRPNDISLEGNGDSDTAIRSVIALNTGTNRLLGRWELFGSIEIMHFLSNTAFNISFIEITLDGATYFIPNYGKHRPACRKFLSGELYERETHLSVAAFLHAFPGNVIHAGTFFGDMIPSFSTACGLNGLLYAFEPLLENYILARLCIDRNGLKNVLLFNSALADKIGNCSISRYDKLSANHLGGGSRISDSGDVSSVTLTIDSLQIDQVSVLQLDVEGFELKALSGGRETIAQCRPLIMIEDKHKECDAFLTGLSYTKVGRIPGLGIWRPTEREDYLAPVKPLVKALRRSVQVA